MKANSLSEIVKKYEEEINKFIIKILIKIETLESEHAVALKDLMINPTTLMQTNR